MKKIIYFDSWTRGIQNYCSIDRLLRNDYQTLLLHVESLVVPYFAPHVDTSWYKDEKEQVISGIHCKDISAYNGMTIMDILKTEAPNVVVQLNVSHLQNRMVTAACKRLGIQVVFMMHGAIRNLNEAQALATSLTESHKHNVSLKVKKIRKYIRLLREYHAASGKMSDTLNIARQVFSSPFKFTWNPEPHFSLNVDKSFVYTIADIHSLSEVFGIPLKNSMAVGNLKLDQILSEPHQKTKRQLNSPRLLYIEGSVNDLKLMDDSQQMSILSFLDETAKQNKLEFVIRLHPGTNRKNFIQKFGSEYQYSPADESLKNSLLNATIITGHQSTAMLESIAYRIPTISLSWFGGALQRIVVNEHDVGIVRQKSAFEEKLREFLKNGWMQEETRKTLFPRGDIPAAESIVAEMRKLADTESDVL
ncbi:MAG: hypothetical protein ACR2PY_01620 [Salinispira sp.]